MYLIQFHHFSYFFLSFDLDRMTILFYSILKYSNNIMTYLLHSTSFRSISSHSAQFRSVHFIIFKLIYKETYHMKMTFLRENKIINLNHSILKYMVQIICHSFFLCHPLIKETREEIGKKNNK